MKSILSILLLAFAASANADSSSDDGMSYTYIGITNSPYTNTTNPRATSVMLGHMVAEHQVGKFDVVGAVEAEVMDFGKAYETETTVGGAAHVSLDRLGIINGAVKFKAGVGTHAQLSAGYEHFITLSPQETLILTGGFTKLRNKDLTLQVGAALLF